MQSTDTLFQKDLKAILYSKRSNIYYIERCRVMVKDGRVTYLTQAKNEYYYYNIPIANTTVLLLGNGTSITQAAVRYLASAGVMIGFSGNQGTPLFAGTEIEWISSKSEYRPTLFFQQWISFWYEQSLRLAAAKKFQSLRIDFIKKVYSKDSFFRKYGFLSETYEIKNLLNTFETKISNINNISDLLLAEAKFTKDLYRIASQKIGKNKFVRDRNENDSINQNLNHGNYLAYGLASVAIWALGLSPSFAVMHGKTRRGALVFDVADLIKDAIVLPLSFCMNENSDDNIFRSECIKYFTDYKVLDFMFNSIENTAREFSQIKLDEEC